jgi:hypothetical protein
MSTAAFRLATRRIRTGAAVVFTTALVASPVQAAPLEGTWVGVEASLSPTPSPHAYSVTAHGGTFTVAYDCGAARCTATVAPVEFAAGQYAAGGFSPPGPYAIFIFVPYPDCRTRYGANAYLGLWTNTGSAPLIAECFAPPELRPIGPSDRHLQRVYPPLRPRNFNIPPYVRRPQLDFPPPGGPTPPPPHAGPGG